MKPESWHYTENELTHEKFTEEWYLFSGVAKGNPPLLYNIGHNCGAVSYSACYFKATYCDQCKKDIPEGILCAAQLLRICSV